MAYNYKLFAAIKEKFGTQAVFAKRVKRSTSFVSEVVNGRRFIEEPIVAEWACILDIPTDLFTDTINA